MAQEPTDLFRFLVQRSARRSTPALDAKYCVPAFATKGAATALHKAIRTSERAAWLHLRTPRFRRAVRLAAGPMGELDGWLREKGDLAPPDEAVARILAMFKEPDLKAVETGQQFRDDREVCADAILAVSSIGTNTLPATRPDLVRMLHLFGMVSRLSDGILADATALRDYLTRAIVLLPLDLFGGAEAMLDEPIEPVGPVGPVPAPVAGPAVPARVTATERFAAMQEIVDAVLLSTEARTREAGGDIRAAWTLDGETRSALSPAARALLEPLGEAAGRLPLPALWDRLEAAPAAPEGEIRASTTMLRLGGSMVPAESRITAPLLPPMAVAALPAGAVAERIEPRLLMAPSVGDLQVVRQTLLRYEPGEVAHIENVMQTELRRRDHRILRREEETTVREEERETFLDRDTQTTERFEMQKESQSTIESQASLQAGINVSATYGTVVATASLGVSTSNSQSHAQQASSRFGRDVTERSASRVRERIRTERTQRSTFETEEKNRHQFDNTGPGGHVRGIYCWADKVYRAQVFNYGKRMLLEFMVPEPSALFRYSAAKAAVEGVTLQQPTKPKDPGGGKDSKGELLDLNPGHVTPQNYLSLIGGYGATDAKPPSPNWSVVGQAWKETMKAQDNMRLFYDAKGELTVPDGYEAVSFVAAVHTSFQGDMTTVTTGTGGGADGTVTSPGGPVSGSITVGGVRRAFGEGSTVVSGLLTASGQGRSGTVAVALDVRNAAGFSCAVEILCRWSQSGREQWQIDTFGSIMRAYAALQSEYDAAVAALETRRGVAIQGRNPLENERIVREELKRSVLALLRQESTGVLGAVAHFPNAQPQISTAAVASFGPIVRFFEKSIEWTQLTYTPYPYFWTHEAVWPTLSQLRDTDPIFAEFLRAGWARVVVPVEPQSVAAACYYLATGNIWDGDQIPQVNDPLYISIIQELQGAEDTKVGTPVGEPWLLRLPTTETHLRESGELPIFAT